jgi:hypothetical protein
MAKTLARVLTVSIAALLFAGCGGSGLSPAQKERCDRLADQMASDEALMRSLRLKYGPDTGKWPITDSAKSNGASSRMDSNSRERAQLGC